MKNSKKGVTLVELIICCAIIVMLGGACTAVLASGSTIFNQSTSAANAQLDSDVLQSFMRNVLPSAKSVKVVSAESMTLSSATYLFFDESNDGLFTIRVNGTDTSIRSVSDFSYTTVRAGDGDSETAKIQFQYTVKFADGSTLNSGFILGNAPFDSALSGDLKTAPIGFSVP